MKKGLEGFSSGDRVTLKPAEQDAMFRGEVGVIEGFFGHRLRIRFGSMFVFRAPEMLLHCARNSPAVPRGDRK